VKRRERDALGDVVADAHTDPRVSAAGADQGRMAIPHAGTPGVGGMQREERLRFGGEQLARLARPVIVCH
jgi:hypothetical protein